MKFSPKALLPTHLEEFIQYVVMLMPFEATTSAGLVQKGQINFEAELKHTAITHTG